MPKTTYCPYCGEESGNAPAGDEIVDYCYECEKVIEGELLDFSVVTMRELDDLTDQLTYIYKNDGMSHTEKLHLKHARTHLHAVIDGMKARTHAERVL